MSEELRIDSCILDLTQFYKEKNKEVKLDMPPQLMKTANQEIQYELKTQR